MSLDAFTFTTERLDVTSTALRFAVAPSGRAVHVTRMVRGIPSSVARLTWNSRRIIEMVEVYDPADRRRGIATEMLRVAREAHPGVRHSRRLTDDGRAWARSTPLPV